MSSATTHVSTFINDQDESLQKVRTPKFGSHAPQESAYDSDSKAECTLDSVDNL